MSIEFNLQKCVDNLGPEEKAKIEQLRLKTESWEGPDITDEFIREKDTYLNDITFYRYLFGWEWNVANAEKALRKSLNWRVSFKPKSIALKDLRTVAVDGWMFHYGKDKIGHPLIWLVVKNDKLKKTDEVKEQIFRYLVWTMERCLDEMKGTDAHRITWIIELKDASISFATAKSLKDLFYNLGEYYPERLARCVVLNASWLLNTIWVFAQQFMTKSTIAKYTFIKGSKDSVREELSKLIDPSQLPKDYYGDADWHFDIDEEIKKDEERNQLKNE